MKEAPDIKPLPLREADIEPDKCARCGACLAFCPVYQATLIERFSPRGKNYLIKTRRIKKHQLPIKETISACLQCGACTAGCSSGVDVAKAIREERSGSRYFQGLPHSLFTIWERLGDKPTIKAINFLGKISPLFKKGLGEIDLAPTPFLGNPTHYLEDIDMAPPEIVLHHAKRVRVCIFVGCVQNFLFPEVAAKTTLLAGADVWIPRAQNCCGLPAYSHGAFRQAKNFIKKNLKGLSQGHYDILLTGCASCAYMIKKWPEILGQDHDMLAHAQRAARSVMELSQFLREVILVPKPEPVTEGTCLIPQIPCHQRFGLRDGGSLPALIASLDKVHMGEGLLCCGLGGGFSVLHPEISREIFKKNILAPLEDMRINQGTIVTTCSGCLLRLKGNRHLAATGVEKVLHVADLFI